MTEPTPVRWRTADAITSDALAQLYARTEKPVRAAVRIDYSEKHVCMPGTDMCSIRRAAASNPTASAGFDTSCGGPELHKPLIAPADMEYTPENGAWHTVCLEGNWRYLTTKMTTEQREYAADRVAAYGQYLDAVDGDPGPCGAGGLRW